MTKLVLFVTLFFLSFAFYAQENHLLEKIQKQLKLKDDAIFAIETKVIPNNAALSIIAIGKYTTIPNNDGFDCTLLLLLIDNKTEKIITQYTENNKYTSDAIRLSSISIDMANYKISETVRAFGIRSNFSGSSQVNPYSLENISLYTIKNNKIEKVLDEYEMSSGIGEWDMRCNYEGEESESIFIMQKEKSEGYFNILVKTKVTKRKNTPSKRDENDCIETIKKLKPSSKILMHKKGIYK
ncbi:hypothetical protein [Flavobacterium sp.]|uniref:hypothetical protein n=1 Tax=Flavobacterium sp. TaxID=239 RepID=UPI00286DE249|nr:hypothetical protein [Flavobacterium sp.]